MRIVKREGAEDILIGCYNIESLAKKEVVELGGKENCWIEINSSARIIKLLQNHNIEKNDDLVKDNISNNPQNAITNSSNSTSKDKKLNRKLLEINCIINELGISLITSKPQELSYVFLQKIKLNLSFNAAYKKMLINIGDLQIDNQLSYDETAVVLKRKQYAQTKNMKFLHIKVHQKLSIEDSESIGKSGEQPSSKVFLL